MNTVLTTSLNTPKTMKLFTAEEGAIIQHALELDVR